MCILWNIRFSSVIVDFIDKLNKNPNELEILGDGKQQKPYLHVSDCVDGIIYGFEHADDQINLFNLGCDTNTTVTNIAEFVVNELNLQNVEFKYTGGKRGWKGDVPRFQLDFTKMKKLGWKPNYTSDEAIKKSIHEIASEIM